MSAEVDWAGIAYFQELDREEQSEEAFFERMPLVIKEIVEENSPQQANALSPMQLMSQMNETLSKESNFFGHVLNIKGIYKQGNGTLYNNGYYYDNLKDENNGTQVKILVPTRIRTNIKPDSLVILCGMVTKKVDNVKGCIELLFRVDSIVEEVKAQAIDKDEQKRIELRQRKVAAGFKNVDSILETLLFDNVRPRIAVVLAQNSIVLADFENGKRAASVAMDFVEDRVTFTQTSQLCAKLRSLDQQGYNAIALVRGGGIDSKTDVDKPEVIETVVRMNTPVISGVGHKDEIIFLRQVADKWTSTPQGLGQYFAELVENVTAKRNNSRAALEADIKKQFKDLLNAEKKRNEDLNQQITKLNEANKTTNDALKKQTDSLTELQKANGELNKSVQQLTIKHSLATTERDIAQEKVKNLQEKMNGMISKTLSFVWMIIAFVALCALGMILLFT